MVKTLFPVGEHEKSDKYELAIGIKYFFDFRKQKTGQVRVRL